MARLRILTVVVGIFFSSGMVHGEDRYERWLEEEVNWIIGKDEKKRFEALSSDEEKERFVEQFWDDRDPFEGTPENAYKEEHYKRLKYVNEHFREGNVPGWRTDRGRIYIIHGAPVSRRLEQDIEYWSYPGNPYAEYYRGPLTLVFERGGSTFQQRAISESRQGQSQLGIYGRGARNTDIMTNASPRFRLVRAGPGLGTGGAVLTSSGETDRYIGDMFRSPGDILDEQRRDQERRREVWKTLTENVSAEVTYGDLECELAAAQFYRGRESLVVFEVMVRPDQLRFSREGAGVESAKLDTFCEILDAADQYQLDLLDDTVILARHSESDHASAEVAAFSDRFRVPPGEYLLRCLLQDVESRKVGETRLQASVPEPDLESVSMSSLLLTQSVQETATLTESEADEALLFQNLRFPSKPTSVVAPSEPVYLFFEVYEMPGAASDSRFLFDYRLYNQEQVFLKVPLQELRGWQTGRRVSQALQFDLSKLPGGEYTFLVKVVDAVSRIHSMKLASFRVRESVTGGN